MRIPRLLPALVVLAAAGCGESPGLLAPEAPLRLAGPTAYVVVSCPSNLVDGQSGQCSAAGYDTNGVFTGSTATWGTTTTGLVRVSSTGLVTAKHNVSGTAVIQATIEGVTGQANIAINLSDLAVSIGGENLIRPNTYCFYWPSVSGGTGPYTYSWTQSSGYGYPDLDGYQAQSSSSFTLYLTVTDSLGTQRHTGESITVSSSAEICPT